MKRGRFITRLSGIMFLSFSIVIISVIFFSCQNPVSETPNNAKASITVEDVSCTEAWIRLNTEGVSFAREARAELYRDDTLRSFAVLQSKDTLFYDDGLLPSKTYRYKVKLTFTPAQENEQTEITTAEKEAVTMDTTSHDFTWQTYTFGGANGSSYLMDVAIINENDIWAVGEIHTSWTDQYDSNGVWVQPYNAVHWNGTEWELKRIKWADGRTYEKTAIFVFNNNEILFGPNILYDGYNYKYLPSLPVDNNGDGWRVNAMWGVSSDDFYVVGNGGNIAHYDGSSWTKINSGTELDIYDIWGDYNKKKGNYEILAIASKILQSTDRDILKITNTGVEKLDETGIDWSLHGIWFKSNRKYYVVGSGIYRKNKIMDKTWNNNFRQITQYYIYSVRCKEINDVFMCGAFGEVLHYNGKSWHSYLNNDLPYFNGSMLKLSYKGNTVCIVGSDGRLGIIYLGTKN